MFNKKGSLLPTSILQLNYNQPRMHTTLFSLAWLFIKTAAFVAFSYQMKSACLTYLSNPLVSSVSHRNLSLDDIPSIMICAEDQKQVDASVELGYAGKECGPSNYQFVDLFLRWIEIYLSVFCIIL